MELRSGLALRESRPRRAAVFGDTASAAVDIPMDAGYMAISADRSPAFPRPSCRARRRSDLELLGPYRLRSVAITDGQRGDGCCRGGRAAPCDRSYLPIAGTTVGWRNGHRSPRSPHTTSPAGSPWTSTACGALHNACALSRPDAD